MRAHIARIIREAGDARQDAGHARAAVADLAETLLGALESIATLRAEQREQDIVIEGLLARIAELIDGHAVDAVGAEVFLDLEAEEVDSNDVGSESESMIDLVDDSE